MMTNDQKLVYNDKRLSNRRTFIEWGNMVLGPIEDTRGLEQGGCHSDRLYKLTNNEQLQVAQYSELGVDFGRTFLKSGDCCSHVMSAVGQADDVCLMSSSLASLRVLLELTKLYCDKFHVKLVGSKTKLLVYKDKKTEVLAQVQLLSR